MKAITFLDKVLCEGWDNGCVGLASPSAYCLTIEDFVEEIVTDGEVKVASSQFDSDACYAYVFAKAADRDIFFDDADFVCADSEGIYNVYIYKMD